MAEYIGNKCPVCDKKFDQGSEIVVCPHCGAPHHRECYKDLGRCFFEEDHENGFEWKDDAEKAIMRRCPNCGAQNGEKALECTNCGKPFPSDQPEGETVEETAEQDWLGAGRGFTGVYSVGSASILHDGEKIDGVPVGDMRKFVGRAAEYYVPVFYTLKKLGRSLSMNFAAVVGHGMWFISRRMYGRGIIMLALMLLAYSIRAVTMVAVPELAETTLLSEPNLFAQNMPLMSLYLAANIVQYAIIIISGLFGNKIYMETCIRRVKRINSRSKNAQEFNSKLEKKGSVNLPAFTISATLYFIGFYAVSYYAQPLLEFAKKMVDYFM